MNFFLYFLSILWYTIGALVVCGLCVAFFEWLFRRLLGGRLGHGIVIGTSIVGTPVHECGHALMCLVFGHKITQMVLWQPATPDGTLGYVRHSYNPKNPYHQIGNLFIGLGPILSGLGIMALLLWLCVPEAWSGYLDTSSAMVAGGSNPLIVLWESIKLWPSLIIEDSVHIIWRILALLVMLSVSLHVTLSPADIKNSLRALPWYLALVLVFAIVTSLFGSGVTGAIQGALATYQAFTISLFAIVLSCSVVLVLMALLVWIIRHIFSRK